MALVEEDFEQTVVDQRQTLGVRMGALEMPPRFKLNARKEELKRRTSMFGAAD
jgi:hypothetical protein